MAMMAPMAMDFFEKNKHWLIPTAITLLVLILIGFIASSVSCSVAASGSSSGTEAFENMRRVKLRLDQDKERLDMTRSYKIV
jgi:hypothetical protein